MQPWRIIVVRSPEHKQALADLYAPEWRTYTEFSRRRADKQQLPADARAKIERTLDAGDYLADHLGEAPAILLFIADPAMMAITDKNLDRISMVGGGSVYTAVENAMLACVAEGLGCTLTTLHCSASPRSRPPWASPTTGPRWRWCPSATRSGAATGRSPAGRRPTSCSTTPSVSPGTAARGRAAPVPGRAGRTMRRRRQELACPMRT